MSFLRHITVMDKNGINIFHKSYTDSDMDDVLFGALSGAILAFSAEMGDELQQIRMKKQIITFKPYNVNFVVIVSFESTCDYNYADRKINQFLDTEELRNLTVTGYSHGELERVIEEIFDLNGTDLDSPRALEELTGEAFLDALRELDNL